MLENIGAQYAILVVRSVNKTAAIKFTKNWLAVSMLVFAFVLRADAIIGVELQMQLGNPSNANSDTNNHDHFLIQRTVEALDYSDNLREPNWPSWDLTASDVGSSGRSSVSLSGYEPADGLLLGQADADYSGSGYLIVVTCVHRLTARTTPRTMIWYSSCRTSSRKRRTTIRGCGRIWKLTLARWRRREMNWSSFAGQTDSARIASNAAGLVYIPAYTWKIIVVVTNGTGTALNRINTSTRVIAVNIPNIAGVRSAPWTNYLVSVNQLQTEHWIYFFHGTA